MKAFGIGLRNVAKNPKKSLPTILAIAVGMAALYIYTGSNDHMFSQFREMVIKEQYGNYRLRARGCAENGKRVPFEYLIRNLGEVSGKLAHIEGVDYIAPRLHFTGIAASDAGNAVVRGFGGDPDSEARMEHGSPASGRGLSAGEAPQALLGEQALRGLAASVGSSLTLLSTMEGGGISGLDVEVVGAKKGYGENDVENRLFIMTRLSEAQALLGVEDACDAIIVHAERLLPGRDMDLRIAEFAKANALECERWDDMADFYTRSREVFAMNQRVLTAILLLVSFFIVGNAMYMNCMTRMREIGTMRAIGTPKRLVRAILLSEACALSGAGASLGIAAASAAALAINALGGIAHPASVFNDESFFTLIMPSWLSIAAYWTLFIAISAASSLAVSAKALKIPVADSLRTE